MRPAPGDHARPRRAHGITTIGITIIIIIITIINTVIIIIVIIIIITITIIIIYYYYEGGRPRGAAPADGAAELVPGEELLGSGARGRPAESLGPGAMHSLGGSYLGVLQRGGKALLVLDGRRGGALVGRLGLPMADDAEEVSAFCAGGGHLYLLIILCHVRLYRVMLWHMYD